MGRAALDPVDVERGLGERPHVEVLRGARIRRARALVGELAGAGGQLAPVRELALARREDPLAKRLGQAAVDRDDRAERLDQRVRRIERRAAVQPGVEVALAGAERHVEVRDAAGRDVERGAVAGDHPAVEDHRGVAAALVGLEELDDRMAARFLLAVAREAHVDRKLTGPGELACGRQQQVQLALVVGDPTAIQVLAPDLGLERRRLPQLERIGRLHVEVAVAEDSRRAVGVARRAHLAHGERLPVPVDQIALPARVADQPAHPLAGLLDLAGARRIGADRLDPQKLGELVEPLRHGREPTDLAQ